MALDVLSSAAYHDTVMTQKTKADTALPFSDKGTADINITEVPVVATGFGGSQSVNGQETGQKDAATEKQIKDAISRANSKIRANRKTRCEFSYHEDINRVSIKVIDSNTDEVIREIPPEQTLEMVEKMWELAGLLVDEKR